MWQVIVKKFRVGDAECEVVDSEITSRHGDYREALIAAETECPESDDPRYYWRADVEPEGE